MKKVLAATLATVSVMTVSASVMADDAIKVLVNGGEVKFDVQPFIENDRTLVPMRAIFEALGADVAWDEKDRTVVSYDPVSDVSITMQIDKDVMFVDGTEYKLDTPAKIVNDRTFVPLRAISESMNSTVNWDGETRTVTIEKDLTQKSGVGIENPWIDYKSIDEVNAAINESGDKKFGIADITVEGCTVKAYRYMPTSNLTEVVYSFKQDKKEADVTVRMMPGDTDISGISGGEKLEEIKTDEYWAEIYKYKDLTYAIWSCEDADTVYSRCVIIETTTMNENDVKAFIKTLIEDVEENYPKG